MDRLRELVKETVNWQEEKEETKCLVYLDPEKRAFYKKVEWVTFSNNAKQVRYGFTDDC